MICLWVQGQRPHATAWVERWCGWLRGTARAVLAFVLPRKQVRGRVWCWWMWLKQKHAMSSHVINLEEVLWMWKSFCGKQRFYWRLDLIFQTRFSTLAAGDLDVVRRLLAATANPNGASEVLRWFGMRMKQRQKEMGSIQVQKPLVIGFYDVNGNDGRKKMTMRIRSKRTMRWGHVQLLRSCWRSSLKKGWLWMEVERNRKRQELLLCLFNHLQL